MIPNSFLFLPEVGPKRERALWKNGITHWDQYPTTEPPRCIPSKRHRDHCTLLTQAQNALAAQDLTTLATLIPKSEHWRFWGPVAPRVACLDIETTGTHHGAEVTVVGVYDPTRDQTHQQVAGIDLDADNLKRLLAPYDLIVTFNGSGFDLPVLQAHYPGAVGQRPHLDLRTALYRLGYKGGLKRIETALGLARPQALVGVDGYEAVRLWRHHRRGDPHALDTLLAYNDEDIRNLAPLARFATTVLRNAHADLLDQPVAPVPWPNGRPPAELPPPLARYIETQSASA